MGKIIFAGALLATLPAAASAVPLQSGSVHSGARIEALLGYDSAVFKAEDARVTAKGFSYGVQGGYDALVGRQTIIGLEGSYLRSAAKRCGAVGDDVDVTRTCLKADYSYYAGARIGDWVTDSVLLYVKGGYAWQHQKATVNEYAVSDGSSVASDSAGQTASGPRFGGGAEVGITDRVYFKVEGTYSTAKKDGVTFHSTDALVGAGYRF